MKKALAAFLAMLLTPFGYAVVDKTIDSRVAELESKVSVLEQYTEDTETQVTQTYKEGDEIPFCDEQPYDFKADYTWATTWTNEFGDYFENKETKNYNINITSAKAKYLKSETEEYTDMIFTKSRNIAYIEITLQGETSAELKGKDIGFTLDILNCNKTGVGYFHDITWYEVTQSGEETTTQVDPNDCTGRVQADGTFKIVRKIKTPKYNVPCINSALFYEATISN